MNNKRSTRILTIGFNKLSGIEACSWNEPDIPLATDYDFVFLNFCTLTVDSISRYVLHQRLNSHLVRFIMSGGILVILVDDAEVKTGMIYPNGQQSHGNRFQCLPIPITFTGEKGEVIHKINDGFDKYLSNYNYWNFHFNISNKLNKLVGTISSYQENNEGHMLSGVLSFENGAAVIVLPEINSIDHDTTLKLIINQLTGTTFESVIPEWALDINIPGIDIINKSLLEIDKKEKELILERKTLIDSRTKLLEYTKLIYSTGQELEDIIEKCLKQLGATIKEEKYGNEEYVMLYKGNEYLIEIKGKEKSIKLTDERQLLNHMIDAQDKTNQEFKGILLGNAWRNIPLNERGNQEHIEFPINVIELAKRNDIALVSCKDFFNEICEFLAENKTGDEILDKIVSSKGIVNFN